LHNKANQPDQFFVRAAHEKRSGYLQRYVSKDQAHHRNKM
jgi:hypothetical protein